MEELDEDCRRNEQSTECKRDGGKAGPRQNSDG
jgi:hypothetical protein